MHEPVYLLTLAAPPELEIRAANMRDSGVKLVEVGGWGKNFDYSDLTAIRQARAILDTYDIEVYSYHPPFGGRYDVSVLDEGTRAQAVQLNLHQVEVAAALGAKYYVMHPSDRVPTADYLLRRRNAIRGIRSLCRAGENAGVAIAIENLPPGYVADRIDELMWIVDACESEAAGVCLDTGHAHYAGWNIGEAIRRIGERLFTIHWHDNDGQADRHWLPGKGTIDWRQFFDALKEIGWNRPICLEAAPPEDIPYEQFAKQVRQALEAGRPMF